MPVKTDRKLVELAGVYATAMELALRGWHASPTVGGFPQVDLHAFNLDTGKRLTIQVKSRSPDQKTNTVRQENGRAGSGGGWGVGTWQYAAEVVPGFPAIPHSSGTGFWSLHGFAVESDVYVFVWFEKNGVTPYEFFVIPTATLGLRMGPPDLYLARHAGQKNQPCWIGKKLLAGCEGAWDSLNTAPRAPKGG